jgi:pseudaminic acid synthase
VAAVALGAVLIEKHLTMSRAAGGPDSAFSLEPAEFKSLVEAIRSAEKSLGEIHYGVSPREARTRPFRRSLFVVSSIKKGDRFTEANVRSIRPANGLHPRHLAEILGQHASCDIESGTPMSWRFVNRS